VEKLLIKATRRAARLPRALSDALRRRWRTRNDADGGGWSLTLTLTLTSTPLMQARQSKRAEDKNANRRRAAR
jgi:hypothetical protein